jgi:hypothetical protein
MIEAAYNSWNGILAFHVQEQVILHLRVLGSLLLAQTRQTFFGTRRVTTESTQPQNSSVFYLSNPDQWGITTSGLMATLMPQKGYGDRQRAEQICTHELQTSTDHEPQA